MIRTRLHEKEYWFGIIFHSFFFLSNFILWIPTSSSKSKGGSPVKVAPSLMDNDF